MLAKNPLGLDSMDDLIAWTTSYFHFKQALEAINMTPEQTRDYLVAFEKFRERLRIDLRKQSILEANLPKSMRDKIAAEKPNLAAIQSILDHDNNA